MPKINQHRTSFIPFHLFEKTIRHLLFFMLFLSFAKSLRDNHADSHACNAKPFRRDVLFVTDNIKIPLTYSNEVEKLYECYPDRYHSDMETLRQTMSVMAKDPGMHSKMAKLIRYSGIFKIKLTTSAEMSQRRMVDSSSHRIATTVAAYNHKESQLILPIQQLYQEKSILESLLYHEFHHAYIGAINKHYKVGEHARMIVQLADRTIELSGLEILKLKDKDIEQKWLKAITTEFQNERNEKNGYVYWDTTPCPAADTKKLFCFFRNMYHKLLDHLLMIDLIAHRASQESTVSSNPLIMGNAHYESQRALHIFNKTLPMDEKDIASLLNVTKDYKPKVISFLIDHDEAQDYISKGFLDKNYHVIKPFSNSAFGITLYTSSVKVDNDHNQVMLYSHTVKSLSVEDRMKAAFLDGYYFFMHVKELYYKDESILLKELDAYLHEVYEPYPELFQYISSELINYHKRRDIPTLKKFSSSFFAEKNNVTETALSEYYFLPEQNNTDKLNLF